MSMNRLPANFSDMKMIVVFHLLFAIPCPAATCSWNAREAQKSAQACGFREDQSGEVGGVVGSQARRALCFSRSRLEVEVVMDVHHFSVDGGFD